MQALRATLLLTAAITFGLGISLPLMRLEKLYIFSETPSLLQIISDLWAGGETVLCIVVAVFSVAFPLLKLFTAFQTILNKKQAGGWTATLAKWSMMDVLLVAIAVFAVKTSGLGNAFTQPGLWFFAVSAISVAIASTGFRKS